VEAVYGKLFSGRVERQVMPNASVSGPTAHDVAGDHRAGQTSDDFLDEFLEDLNK
jgi:hypothetical protein